MVFWDLNEVNSFSVAVCQRMCAGFLLQEDETEVMQEGGHLSPITCVH